VAQSGGLANVRLMENYYSGVWLSMVAGYYRIMNYIYLPIYEFTESTDESTDDITTLTPYTIKYGFVTSPCSTIDVSTYDEDVYNTFMGDCTIDNMLAMAKNTPEFLPPANSYHDDRLIKSIINIHGPIGPRDWTQAMGRSDQTLERGFQLKNDFINNKRYTRDTLSLVPYDSKFCRGLLDRSFHDFILGTNSKFCVDINGEGFALMRKNDASSLTTLKMIINGELRYVFNEVARCYRQNEDDIVNVWPSPFGDTKNLENDNEIAACLREWLIGHYPQFDADDDNINVANVQEAAIHAFTVMNKYIKRVKSISCLHSQLSVRCDSATDLTTYMRSRVPGFRKPFCTTITHLGENSCYELYTTANQEQKTMAMTSPYGQFKESWLNLYEAMNTEQRYWFQNAFNSAVEANSAALDRMDLKTTLTIGHNHDFNEDWFTDVFKIQEQINFEINQFYAAKDDVASDDTKSDDVVLTPGPTPTGPLM
jgi:hypothetical protein